MTFQSFSYKTKTFYIDLIGVMKSVSMSVQSVIAKPVDWIEIFGDLLNEIGGEKPIYFLKPELSGFIWERGKLLIKIRMGCPSTPIQGQPNLHDN